MAALRAVLLQRISGSVTDEGGGGSGRLVALFPASGCVCGLSVVLRTALRWAPRAALEVQDFNECFMLNFVPAPLARQRVCTSYSLCADKR